MKKMIVIGTAIMMFVVCGLLFIRWDPEYAYIPPDHKIVNNEITHTLQAQSDPKIGKNPTQQNIEFGKQMFFEETFGNEVFFTDILGVFDGPLSLANITKAVVNLKGQGTTNLKVRAAKTATIAGKKINKGDWIETGLDVPKGAYMPLGIKISYGDSRLKAGISCTVCHASVDPVTGLVVQGVPNTDLNIGQMLAMGTNTAAYFTHTNIKDLKKYLGSLDRKITNSEGKIDYLPDPALLEEAVDRDIAKWPRGSNDTTLDFMNNPVQIPDTFTLGDFPYGWSGQGLIGPNHGLTAAINNAHVQNTDATSQTEVAKPMLGVDKEVYLGTLLQNAATRKYRYKPDTKEKPTKFFAKVDPTPGTPGVNELVKAPTFPKASYLSTIGMFQSSPGYKVWEQGIAMSAYMNATIPPTSKIKVDQQTIETGKRVFQEAGCITCHSGEFYTSNRVIPVDQIGTNPSRAAGFIKTRKYFASTTQMYTPDTPVPLPKGAKTMKVPMTKQEHKQLRLGWVQSDSKGGYKIPSLWGLLWSAPYLHDAGVAVGPDASTQIGIPGTLNKGILPDPANSLRALVDRNLREKVIVANQTSADVPEFNTGVGHTFWVDQTAGFTKEEQEALIRYLLTLPDHNTRRYMR